MMFLRLCRPMSGEPMAHRRGLLIYRGSASGPGGGASKIFGRPAERQSLSAHRAAQPQEKLFHSSGGTAAREALSLIGWHSLKNIRHGRKRLWLHRGM